ncbi:UNKNOWN [Stylonychia lemnae]|uniref:Thioesterase domain-containing protein n=1 Tax=Stylonychia lemnae TaxID=5949 RepID=A0A077ZP57_STYLE|nr:UNKNOWN [Stylonychia lemnae]|eukprot:CDW71747.1 UNKNOWN [Stylonychia lemnae]
METSKYINEELVHKVLSKMQGTNEVFYSDKIQYTHSTFEEGLLCRSHFVIKVTNQMKDKNDYLTREVVEELLDFLPFRACDGFENFRPKITLKLSIQFVNKVPVGDQVIFQSDVQKVGKQNGALGGKMIDPVSNLVIAQCQSVFIYADELLAKL